MKRFIMMLVLFAGLALTAQNVPLVLTAPNGGELWQAGSVYDITWEQTNLWGAVSLHLISPLSSQPPLVIAMNIPVQVQVFHWQIPASILPGDFYKVMISMTSNPTNSFSDISDAPFTILGGDPPPPPQQMITVLSPNGGEQWVTGSTHTINWSSQGLDGEVVITLVQDNGTGGYQIANQVPIQSGSYSWTIPDDLQPGNGYKIHVMWLSVLTVYFGDLSDGPFSIVGSDPPPPPPQWLNLLSPNGGETWQAGTMHPITWVQAFNAIHPLTIELYIGLNNTFQPIQIATGIPSFPPQFNWMIPSTLTPSDHYYIKISTPSADGTMFGDFSDAPFTIVSSNPPPPPQTYISVLNPNGGEVWPLGSTQTINWTSQGLQGDVVITLVQTNGVTAYQIGAQVPITPGTFTWTIPDDISPGSGYRVHVMWLSDLTVYFGDVSDATFSITSPNPPPSQTLQIISPNGGETWMAGAMHPITWEYEGYGGPVMIQLMGGPQMSPIVIIAQNIPAGTEIFHWNIPATLMPGNAYQVQISLISSNGMFISDISDAPFSIMSPDPPPPPPQMLQIISPNGGETWMAGTMHPITWVQAFNAILPVTLTLHDGMDPTVAPIPIAVDIPSYPSILHWMVPAGLPLSNQYLVRISTTFADGYLVEDWSDAPFSVVSGNPPPPQTLRVIAPNGGEHWMAGTMHPIRWQAHQVQGPVEIALIRGDNPQPVMVIAPNLPLPGMFRWMIPIDLEAANDYRIRVRVQNGNLIDLSDAPFTIFEHQAPPPSNVVLTSPNGGETWQAGNSYTITWNAPELNVPMQLWLLREGQRQRYRHIISPSLPNTGSYEWTIPPGIPPGDNFKVMVRALHTPGQMDISDAVFSIVTNPAKLKATTNKGSDAVTISLDSESSVPAQVKIYNIRGQVVRDLGTLNLGSTRSVIWDTRDDRGQKTSPGLYLIRVKMDREYLSQRVLLTK